MYKKRSIKLPKFIADKITKTGYTRGADDDVIHTTMNHSINLVTISVHWR